ncbi:alanine--glyoxylate aminotransferase family protein [Egicoccus sp. AB-alg2]|uniref:pyridoxal-phosphate-dependent aminotransferase family protein n=1 Tax=Egicoccus sp. AB-alg2 TaxID=3242693 RepID=UPI00359CEC21
MRAGRHFLQIPGPTNVPDRVLQAIARPTIDHRGPEFAALGRRVLTGLRQVFRTEQPVIVYPSSGTGAWEAALVNTLSPGDAVLMYETGHFSTLWSQMAGRLGLDVEVLAGDWRTGVDAGRIHDALTAAPDRYRAVAVVHNETSTGVTSDVAAVRRALDEAGSDALLLADTISSLGSIDYRHDEWGVDVTVCGSQKGLMLPPGLGFNAISAKARAATGKARLPRSYWDWEDMLATADDGFFPYTPATNLLYGLAEAIDLLLEEGLDQVFARHDRHGEATRRAVEHWGLELLATVPDQRSSALTAVLLPEGHDADHFRRVALERFDVSLGAGLARLRGRVFRIGHLGDFNDLMLAGTLAGVEAALRLAGVPIKGGGVEAAMAYLAEQP